MEKITYFFSVPQMTAIEFTLKLPTVLAYTYYVDMKENKA